jgi:4-amino-4-deoxy-L-arabinose transferase-like glycosyltransferase
MDPTIPNGVLGFLIYILIGYTGIFMLNIKGYGATLGKYEDINQPVAVKAATVIVLLWPICPVLFKITERFFRKYHAKELNL